MTSPLSVPTHPHWELQILKSVFQYSMDKFTKNYIDDMVRPMMHRIEALERSNAELQVQVKYLESLITGTGTYQKPTISAVNHMRDSRISSKGENSAEKRPNWNSKTKVQQSPVSNAKEPVHHEKLKTKPPIPKLMKSPNKNDPTDEMRNSAIDKKILGGVKCQADNSQKQVTAENALASPLKSEAKQTQTHQENASEQNTAETKVKVNGVSNSFEQLVKNNTEILASMKDNTLSQRQVPNPRPPPPNNYVLKANSPKSEFNHSLNATPHDRSFASQANPQQKALAKPPEGLKINLDCNMVKIELK